MERKEIKHFTCFGCKEDRVTLYTTRLNMADNREHGDIISYCNIQCMRPPKEDSQIKVWMKEVRKADKIWRK